MQNTLFTYSININPVEVMFDWSENCAYNGDIHEGRMDRLKYTEKIGI